LPDVFILFLISPSLISLPLYGVINDLNYFLTLIVTRMYPSNSLMDGSVIDSFLLILKVSVTALRAVSQCRKIQAFIPAVPKECAPPMCALLFARVLLQFSPARFFLGPASLLLMSPLLVAFFLYLTLPLVEKDARSDPGFGPGRLPNFNMAFKDTRGFSVDLFECNLSRWIHCSILSRSSGRQDLNLSLFLSSHHVNRKAYHILGKRMAIQFHLVVKLEVPFLDSFLDPHPEDPAVVME
jgi:hypothetical protein